MGKNMNTSSLSMSALKNKGLNKRQNNRIHDDKYD